MTSAATHSPKTPTLLRFTAFQRQLHVVLMTSFLGLALTGLPLLFADAPWATRIAHALGGFRAAGILHRTFAVALIGCFSTHVAYLVDQIFIKKHRQYLWGPESMVPQPRDLAELFQHVRWFLGLAERPQFDHFTYWEKFDYWAVFWGMIIIGGSGLLLWFPVFFAILIPGWIFNIALLVHGEEALLAVAFIFTIHFFNGHLRPEKFPMDTVIFTGRISRHELKDERPGEWARLVQANALEALESGPPNPTALAVGRVYGTVAVLMGLGLFGLILYAVLNGVM